MARSSEKRFFTPNLLALEIGLQVVALLNRGTWGLHLAQARWISRPESEPATGTEHSSNRKLPRLTDTA